MFSLHDFDIYIHNTLLVYLYFCEFSERDALHVLKASDWHLEGAFDIFYSQPQPPVKSSIDITRIEELYDRYKGMYLSIHS